MAYGSDTGSAAEPGMALRSPAGLARRANLWRSIAVALASAVLFLLIPTLTGGHVSHDVAWYLQAARMWLGGAELYRDVMDVNPPMIIYLAAPAEAVAQLFDWPAHAVFYGMLCSFLAGALIWSGAILSRYGVSRTITAFFTAFLFLIFGVAPIYELGQREHFVMILTLPYLLQVGFAPDLKDLPILSPGERIVLGLCAGIGFAIKPYILVVPALIVLAQCARARSLRPAFTAQSLALALVVAAYGLVVVFGHPQYLASVVPLAAATYGGYGSTLAATLQPAGLAVLGAAALLALWARPVANRIGQPVFFAALAAAGFLVAFLVQGKGWIYHAMPLVAWLGIVAVLQAQRSEAGRSTVARSVMAVIIAAILWVPLFHFSPHLILKERSDALVAALGPNAENRRIVSWSASLNGHFPAVTRINGQWSSRFQCLWGLPGALALAASNDPADAARGVGVLDTFRTLAVDDFIKNKPEIVLVPRSLDVPALFQVDPRFGEKWRNYQKVADVHTLEIWIAESLIETDIGRSKL